jgi:hypothetical protein
MLATLAVSANNLGCTSFPSYCNWTSASLGFFRDGEVGHFYRTSERIRDCRHHAEFYDLGHS